MDKLTPREGIAGIAFLAMFSDGVVAPEEDDALHDYVASMTHFEGASEREIADLLVRLERLERQHGDRALLDSCCAAVAGEHGRLAFAVAADILAADGSVAVEESEFLLELQRGLGLSDHDARKVLDEITG